MDFEVYDVMVVPLIMGLVAVAKRMGAPDKALPALSLAAGLVIGVTYFAQGDARQGALMGTMFGLAASGLYSGGKALGEKDGGTND